MDPYYTIPFLIPGKRDQLPSFSPHRLVLPSRRKRYDPYEVGRCWSLLGGLRGNFRAGVRWLHYDFSEGMACHLVLL